MLVEYKVASPPTAVPISIAVTVVEVNTEEKLCFTGSLQGLVFLYLILGSPY